MAVAEEAAAAEAAGAAAAEGSAAETGAVGSAEGVPVAVAVGEEALPAEEGNLLAVAAVMARKSGAKPEARNKARRTSSGRLTGCCSGRVCLKSYVLRRCEN